MSDLHTEKPAENQGFAVGPGLNGHDPAPDGHAAETAIELAAKTLAGDLRDFTLDLLRELRDPWHKLPENQQRYHAERIADRCQSIVTRGVTLIAGRDFPTVSVALEQVTFKPKGIETKMTMSGLDRQRRHELVDAQNKVILLVIADPSAFMGSRGPVKIEVPAEEEKPAAEPELPLAAELDTEARRVGHEDGFAGDRRVNPYPPGQSGHGDYELGYQAGERARAAVSETAAA